MERLTVSYEDDVNVNLDFTTTQLSPPFGLTATPVVGGGTFAAGTYYYEVTAQTALGETTVSNEANAVVALNGSVNLAWNAPQGVVTGYKVYRGTAPGTENVLVTTIVGTATTFTDTNVGGAGTPPGTNTATLSDYVLITGYAKFCGHSVAETSGTAGAWIEIQDNSNRLAESRLASSASDTRSAYGDGIPVNGFIKVHVNSGAVRGTVYARIPPVGC